MAVYWLLSVPAHGDGHIAWRDVKSKVVDSELYDFSLPQFRIGTLDALVRLSDELSKFDTSYESMTGKLLDTLRNLTSASNAELSSLVTVDDKTVDQYLKTFSWNTSKYRADRSLVEIVDQIAEDMGAIDAALKTKLTQYNAIKNSLATVKRKQTGNLSVKALGGIVRREHCLVGSDYLQTVFVAVPRTLTKQWRNSYERLTDMVVPRSSQLIAEDSEYSLFSAIVFKRARDARFIVRDFEFDEQQLEQDRLHAMEIVEQEEELLANISEWCKGSFSDVFAAWVHIKALRVFVESILRYGIPPDFLPLLVKPNPKQAGKIKQSLSDFYAYLETSSRVSQRAGKGGKKEDAFDMHEFQSILSDFTPFVFL
ncbi:ATPase V1 complex subunit C [Linderina pennispora]|uniref:V-type proton ATPase subunit C n=1 Tax=Linderina pennispora TaxID=61395 RepID=A0A1Y1WCK8_9FUNG|nr:ATPase V1 complex subunit C [Linderina pennispora]ORX70884.1 ATPase V1 complex subunit C [Linderina pennispora]